MSDVMERDEAGNGDMPEIPDFDPKMIRRASRRGIRRVVLIVLLVVGALFAAVDFGAGAVARAQHPNDTAYKAFIGTFLAHPGYQPEFGVGPGVVASGPAGGSISRLGDYKAVFGFQQVDPLGTPIGAPTVMQVHKPLFGSASAFAPMSASKLENAIRKARLSKDATRRVLAGLPASSATSAAIELTTPISESELKAVAARLGFKISVFAAPNSEFFDSSIFTPMHKTTEVKRPDGLIEVLGEQAPLVAVSPFFTYDVSSNSGLRDFSNQALPEPDATSGLRAYADAVSDSDSELLIGVGLPPANELKAIAKDAKIYGFTVSGLSPAQIAKVLDSAEVRSVSIGDAVLNTAG